MAIDPNNGDVIALVSTPGFDPNPFGRGLTNAEYGALRDNIDMPLLNRAIRGEYPPGSTVKPAIALGGLTLGITTPQRTKILPRVFLCCPARATAIRDWRPSGHGVVAMETAIAQSCDVYFYELSSMMGVDKLSGWLAHFGLGDATDIDIGGERKGILPTPAWKKARFKNRGRPGVVSRRDRELRHRPGISHRHADAGRAHDVHPRRRAARASSRGWSPPTASRARARSRRSLPNYSRPSRRRRRTGRSSIDGMVRVMNGGTGRRSQVGAEYQIAGKTGTAQVFTVGRTRATKKWRRELNERLLDHGWFIAFAPADAPKLAVAVLIENGKHGTAAAPIARRVLDQFLLGKTTTPEISAYGRPPRAQRPRLEAPGDE